MSDDIIFGKNAVTEALISGKREINKILISKNIHSDAKLNRIKDLARENDIIFQFVAKEKFDVDNFSKSLIDAIFENFGDDDNLVQETKCTRIGTCEHYSEGLIRFRLYNI